MNSISGIEKLAGMLSQAAIEKLEKAAQRHVSSANMTFTILLATEATLEIEVTQAETKSGNYATEATLISRTQELFGNFFPKVKLNIFPVTYAPSLASVVTTAWLETKMQQKGVRIKQIAFDTGVDRESISDWVTGKRSMSQIVKAMFYFYLSK